MGLRQQQHTKERVLRHTKRDRFRPLAYVLYIKKLFDILERVGHRYPSDTPHNDKIHGEVAEYARHNKEDPAGSSVYSLPLLSVDLREQLFIAAVESGEDAVVALVCRAAFASGASRIVDGRRFNKS